MAAAAGTTPEPDARAAFREKLTIKTSVRQKLVAEELKWCPLSKQDQMYIEQWTRDKSTCRAFIAYDEAKSIVGILLMRRSDFDETHAEPWFIMYVVSFVRRCGVASALVQEMRRVLPRAGFTAACLSDASVAFFKKAGFSVSHGSELGIFMRLPA